MRPTLGQPISSIVHIKGGHRILHRGYIICALLEPLHSTMFCGTHTLTFAHAARTARNMMAQDFHKQPEFALFYTLLESRYTTLNFNPEYFELFGCFCKLPLMFLEALIGSPAPKGSKY